MKHAIVSGLITLLALSPAAAQAPWKVPKPDYGGAAPLDGKGDWFRADDYPGVAIYSDQTGLVTVSYAIGTDGLISDCHVVASSGHPILDAVPCRVLAKRARFAPAKDAKGDPIVTHGTTSMSFWTED